MAGVDISGAIGVHGATNRWDVILPRNFVCPATEDLCERTGCTRSSCVLEIAGQATRSRLAIPDGRLMKEIEAVAIEALRSQGKRSPSAEQIQRKMLNKVIVNEAKHRLANPDEPHWHTLRKLLARETE